MAGTRPSLITFLIGFTPRKVPHLWPTARQPVQYTRAEIGIPENHQLEIPGICVQVIIPWPRKDRVRAEDKVTQSSAQRTIVARYQCFGFMLPNVDAQLPASLIYLFQQ